MLVILIVLPILKNTYLYFSYNHGLTGFVKVEGEKGSIVGKWARSYDTMECGMDEHHDILYTFSTDTSGIVNYKYYGEKINGNIANVYSWSSLLPFDKQKIRKHKSNIIIKSNYLIFIPDSSSSDIDLTYAKYEIKNDTLLVDQYRKSKLYNDEPNYKFLYSTKAKFTRLLLFWFEWF